LEQGKADEKKKVVTLLLLLLLSRCLATASAVARACLQKLFAAVLQLGRQLRGVICRRASRTAVAAAAMSRLHCRLLAHEVGQHLQQ